MAYRFKLKDDLQDGVRRIAIEQLDKALKSPHGKADRAVWVHETRKGLKRTRALLRLVRSGLGDTVWKEENSVLRGIARSLSGLRDQHVLQDSLRSMADTGGVELAEAARWLTQALEDGEREPAAPSEKAAAATVAGAITALGKARKRLAGIHVHGDLLDVLSGGLADCQRKARGALAQLEADQTDENVHELRKCIQTCQRQSALLQAAWPELMAVRIATAKACAELLGTSQDLAVLATLVEEHRGGGRQAGRKHAEALLAASRQRQAEIRERVLPAARRLLAQKPKALVEEFRSNWCAAIELAGVGVEPKPAEPGSGKLSPVAAEQS